MTTLLDEFFIANDSENEDSDQTVRMRSLIWVFIERICQMARFLIITKTRLFKYTENFTI